MAWLFGDSFDHYSTAQANRKWNNVSGSGWGNVAAAGRYGTAALQTTGSAVDHRKVLDTPAPSGTTLIVGMAIKPTLPVGFAAFGGVSLDGDTYNAGITFALLGSGAIQIRKGRADGAILGATARGLNTNVWAYLEFKMVFSTTVGVIDVHVNGESWLALSDQNLYATARNTLHLSSMSGSVLASYIDDLYVLDGSGDAPWNDFLGDTRGEALFANANGANSEWDGSDGNKVDNYALVNDNPADDDTSYIKARAATTKDTHKFPTIASDGSIRAVQHLMLMRKTDTATKTVKSVVRGTDNVDRDSVATQNPAQLTYDYYRFNHVLNPRTGLPWTKDEVSGPTGSEYGPKVTV